MRVFDQMEAAIAHFGEGNVFNVVPCKFETAWVFTEAESFETLSVTPSLDASASGHWHGYITAGEIVGGIVRP